jgi:hypothetical protein
MIGVTLECSIRMGLQSMVWQLAMDLVNDICFCVLTLR